MFKIDVNRILRLAGLLEGEEDEDFDNHAEHARVLKQTGFWGAQGAGCIFFAKNTKRFLIAHRAAYDVQEPNEWGVFGGAIDKGESPQEAVRREVREETGYTGRFDLIPLYVFKKSSFRYSNFVAVVENEFKPRLDWETQGTMWCEWGDWPSPMHFGLKALLNDPASAATMKKLASSDQRHAVKESAMRSLINICEWPSEPKMKASPKHNYTITRAVDGGWILMYNGHEMQPVETTKEAAIMAARDMVSGYPEFVPDLMYDMLDEFDGNIHDPGFMPALISALEIDFNKQVRPKLSLVPTSKE